MQKTTTGAHTADQMSETQIDTSAGTALVSGCSKGHRSLAAALLALQPGHDAATPTKARQGSLVSADALPLFLGAFETPGHGFHVTQGKLYQPPHEDQSPRITSRESRTAQTLHALRE